MHKSYSSSIHFKIQSQYITILHKSMFSCSQTLGLYIATLGVVDEVRRFGIGSQLVHKAIDYAK